MKFSDLGREQWKELAPFVDTCLLPITGLTGKEQPWEATEALERLRDVLDLIETPYKGRVATYPAIHYTDDSPLFVSCVDRICGNLKQSGFGYVVVATATMEIKRLGFSEADLVLGPDAAADNLTGEKRAAAQSIEAMWSDRSIGK